MIFLCSTTTTREQNNKKKQQPACLYYSEEYKRERKNYISRLIDLNSLVIFFERKNSKHAFSQNFI
jgi:hypothetical protein